MVRMLLIMILICSSEVAHTPHCCGTILLAVLCKQSSSHCKVARPCLIDKHHAENNIMMAHCRDVVTNVLPLCFF